MPISMKKRYPRAVRFRKIASNNNQTQQVRRFELVPSPSIAANVMTFTFDRPVSILSNAVAVTNMTDDLGIKPVLFEYAGTTNAVNIHFPVGHTITACNVFFEDPAIRDQIGAYIRAGQYVEPG